MANEIKYNTTPDSSHILKSKEMDLESGWLGRCFGSNKNAPMNIAGSSIFLLICSGIAVLFFSSAIPASEYWKLIVPLLTLVMGYIFGKAS